MRNWGFIILVMVIALTVAFGQFSGSVDPIQQKSQDDAAEHRDAALVMDNCARIHADLTMNIPDTDADFMYSPTKGNARIQWQDGQVRGEVHIDTELCQLVVTEPGKSYVIFPFVVTNQGSGVFHYLAVASTDNLVGSSQFLGDRVIIEGVSTHSSDESLFTVSVKMRKHALSQSFSEKPTIDYTKTFYVSSQGIVKPQL